jgi:glycosyltransferase involved in cell wall biosynthesis
LTAIPNATPDLGGVRSDGSARTVIAAGRLTRQKAFAFLIEAFAQVAAAHPEWQLLICGGGPRREHLEKLIDQLDVGANVTLAGPVRNLAAKMTEASIFALSSRFEGFPMVLLEAMSVGLPVVSFDCPTGPREIVEDGRNGLLVPEADVNALAAALIRMIEDDELRRRCSEGALETAGRYSIEAIGARWDELIEWLSHDRRS